MRRAGKADFITITITAAGVAGVIALVVLLFFSRESAQGAANRFMGALSRRDVADLVKLSYYEGSPEELQRAWKYSVDAGQHYLFHWRTVSTKDHDENSAAVLMQIERNYGPTSFEEKIDLPMVKVKGEWKVEVRSLYRGMFPALPGNVAFSKYLESKGDGAH